MGTEQAAQREELSARGRAAALRVAALVRALTPDTSRRRCPTLEWTAIEAAVHVATLYRRALGDRRRSRTGDGTAALNATCIAEFSERDPAAIAERIAVDAATVWDEILPSLPDDRPLDFHAGTTTAVVPIMGVMLGEMLVHGDDIARATAQHWSIDDGDAWWALRSMVVLLPAWQRVGVDPSDTIALTGPGKESVRITSAGHRSTVAHEPAGEFDRIVSARPSEVLLGLFGRRPATSPLADLTKRFGPF